MAPLQSHKLTICVGLLCALLLAPSTLAGEAEKNQTCQEGEEQDDQEEPECCVKVLMKESEHGKICAKLPTSMSVAVAVTLILSFTFLISLQCFMNHHDVGMREYAYTMISSTVSIFSAVLMFQSLDGLLEDFIIDYYHLGTRLKLLALFIHMLLWYVATQFTIAKVSCALKSEEWRKEELNHQHHEDTPEARESMRHNHRNVMLDVEINCVCYGMVLAHLTGFASIRFWTKLQQMEPFSESSLLALLPLPMAVLAQLCFEWLTDTCREGYISLQGEKDFFEKTWDEKCQHAEDDIMGLTLSVLLVNSLRYAINASFGHKCLPNSEQKEEGPQCETEFRHSASEALWLFGFGVLFVVLLFLTKLIFTKISGEEEDEDVRESRRRWSLIAGEAEEEEPEQSAFCNEVAERMEDVILTTWGMAHAWCIFHGTRQLLMVVSPNFLGKESNATTLVIVLACGVTYLALFAVRALDKVKDLSHARLKRTYTKRKPTEVDDAVRTVIRATSIFIGFAWEQTFDESVDQLAEMTRISGVYGAPAIAKLVIGTGCIGVVFFAWKWYILPFVFKKGWRHGYIFSRIDLYERCQELARHDRAFTYDHLRDIAHSLAEQGGSDHLRRFATRKEMAGQCPDGYKALIDSEVEEEPEEFEEIVTGWSQGGGLNVMDLEEELRQYKARAADWEKQRKSLERQLAEERKARLSMRVRGQDCEEEISPGASSQGPPVDEARVREYLFDFLERYLEEERRARARGTRVGEESALTRSETIRSNSRNCMRKVSFDETCTDVSSTPSSPLAAFAELRKTGRDLKKQSKASEQDFGTGQDSASSAHMGEAGQKPGKYSLVEERGAEGYFKKTRENLGQDSGAGQFAASSTHRVREDAAGQFMVQESTSAASSESVKPSLLGVPGYLEKNYESLEQDSGIGHFATPPTYSAQGAFMSPGSTSASSSESVKPSEPPRQDFAMSSAHRLQESPARRFRSPEAASARSLTSVNTSLDFLLSESPESTKSSPEEERISKVPFEKRGESPRVPFEKRDETPGPLEGRTRTFSFGFDRSPESVKPSSEDERKAADKPVMGQAMQSRISPSPTPLRPSTPGDDLAEERKGVNCKKIHQGLEKILADLQKL